MAMAPAFVGEPPWRAILFSDRSSGKQFYSMSSIAIIADFIVFFV
jgi:hypothetical protein